MKLALAQLVLAATATEAVDVMCGDTISESTTLTKSLFCTDCSNGPALTIAGSGVELDLDVYSVSCNNSTYDEYTEEMIATGANIGILIKGTSNVLKGPNTFDNQFLDRGVVEEALLGVVVAGSGGHVVKGVTVQDTGNDGILVLSSENTVTECNVVAAGNGPDGDNNGDGIDVEVGSTKNVISRNYIQSSGDDGLDIDGDDNLILYNNIQFTLFEDGLTLRGTGNRVIGNTISNSPSSCDSELEFGVGCGDGLDIKCNKDEDGDDNCAKAGGGNHYVAWNKIDRSFKRGLKVGVSNCVLESNNVFETFGDGVRFKRDDKDKIPSNNVFRGNKVLDNGSEGILLEDCINCQIDGNIVEGNSEEGIELKPDDECEHPTGDKEKEGILRCSKVSGTTITNNIIKGNKKGGLIIKKGVSGTKVTGNTFLDNVKDNANADFEDEGKGTSIGADNVATNDFGYPVVGGLGR